MERITRLRVTVLLAVFCLLLGFFALRLYDLQIVQTGGDTDNVKKFYTVTRVKAARGDILDRNGNVLVTNRATYDMVFNHFVILSNGNTNTHLLNLVKLCRELGITYNEHFPITMDTPFQYTLNEVGTAGQNHFQAYLPVVAGGLDSDISAPVLIRTLRDYYDIPADWSDKDARAVIGLRYELRLRQGITNLPNYIFLEDVNNETLAAVLELGVPGLNTEESIARVYNTEYGAHILGYIGSITSKQWNEIYKEKEGYEMDALVGQSGLEEAFEEYLHGIDGYRVDVVTADGTLIEQYYQRDDETGEAQKPISGKNVELTIDLDLQTTAEEQLDALITELRQTVDEKLHRSLEIRLGESFKLVNNHLAAVQKGLGEMQVLASDVGDLKKVLTNVKTKGNIGEYQLEGILEEMLTVNQFVKNFAPNPESRDVVEFAVKLPSKKGDRNIFLPIDSKFPTVDYEELLVAYDKGSQRDIEVAKKALVTKIKGFAKDIQKKYILPPVTTDFAIMFLPVEGLFAEVLRVPGLFESIQRECHVTITGPTTVSAFLNSLQMGFRTLEIEQHTDEVWRLLETVRMEFAKFGDILEKTRQKLESATKEIFSAEAKSRTIERKLKGTEKFLM